MLERSGEVRGQVGQLGHRQPLGEGQEIVHLWTQVAGVATAQQEQLGVLGRGEQHASTV